MCRLPLQFDRGEIDLVLTQVSFIRGSNPAKEAWSRLKFFENARVTRDFMMTWRRIPASQKNNVTKQAEQIRFCLLQAREYFESAMSSSSATKPVLLYYGIMSLALADILLKRADTSSLERMREQNAHHGLEMRIIGKFDRNAQLNVSASRLISKPVIRANQERFGTFELWHNIAREAPLIGNVDTISDRVKHSAPNILFGAMPRRVGYLPPSGLTLQEVVERTPGMYFQIGDFGVPSRLVRITFSGHQRADNPMSYQFIIHPGESGAILRVLQACRFAPEAAVLMDLDIFSTGAIAKWSMPLECRLPIAYSIAIDETYLSDDVVPLNEFGLFYIGMHICGMYARYYPDQWMREVEQRTALALAVEQFMDSAIGRVPILALSEFHRKYYIFKH